MPIKISHILLWLFLITWRTAATTRRGISLAPPTLPVDLFVKIHHFSASGGTLANGEHCINPDHTILCTPIFRVCLSSQSVLRYSSQDNRNFNSDTKACEFLYEFGGRGSKYEKAKSIAFGEFLEPQMRNLLPFKITKSDAVLRITVGHRDFQQKNLWEQFDVLLKPYLGRPFVFTNGIWKQKLYEGREFDLHFAWIIKPTTTEKQSKQKGERGENPQSNSEQDHYKRKTILKAVHWDEKKSGKKGYTKQERKQNNDEVEELYKDYALKEKRTLKATRESAGTVDAKNKINTKDSTKTTATTKSSEQTTGTTSTTMSTSVTSSEHTSSTASPTTKHSTTHTTKSSTYSTTPSTIDITTTTTTGQTLTTATAAATTTTATTAATSTATTTATATSEPATSVSSSVSQTQSSRSSDQSTTTTATTKSSEQTTGTTSTTMSTSVTSSEHTSSSSNAASNPIVGFTSESFSSFPASSFITSTSASALQTATPSAILSPSSSSPSITEELQNVSSDSSNSPPNLPIAGRLFSGRRMFSWPLLLCCFLGVTAVSAFFGVFLYGRYRWLFGLQDDDVESVVSSSDSLDSPPSPPPPPFKSPFFFP